MARFAVLHAADLHLDAPFCALGRTPADVASVLRDASVDAWDALVELAIQRDVVAVLLAGGLCDGLERGVRAQARLRDGLRRLVAHGIAVVAALAPRDPIDGLAGAGWPDGVIAVGDGARSVPLVAGGAHLATVHAMAASSRPAAELVRGLSTERSGSPHFGVAHLALDVSEAEAGGCAACPSAVLRSAGLDYWALGHTHMLTHVARLPWIVAPGTIQGRGPAAAENGAKGAVLVEVVDGRVDQVIFEPLDRVRCLRLEVTEPVDLDGLRRTLAGRAAALRETHAGRGLVLEASVDGPPEVLRGLRRPDASAPLVQALRRDAASYEPFVWWTAVRPAKPPHPAPARDDLIGEVWRTRAALAADPESCARFLARRFEPLRYAWAAEVEPREATELLDAAAAAAGDVLDDAEGGA